MSFIRKQQQGTSIIVLLIMVAMIGSLMLVALKVFPTYTEYRAIKGAVARAADSSPKTIGDVQKAFDRSAQIDNIEVLSGKDLDIVKSNDIFTISFSYEKRLPLAGPVSLLITYAGSSTTK